MSRFISVHLAVHLPLPSERKTRSTALWFALPPLCVPHVPGTEGRKTGGNTRLYRQVSLKHMSPLAPKLGYQKKNTNLFLFEVLKSSI